MARTTFGRTWWGERWLNSLKAIDYSNRLARGKTYYNQGKVIKASWNPKTHSIEALVDGSAYYPYEVNIHIPPLSKEKACALLDQIASDPIIVSRLLDMELPQEVADIALSLGIELFPKTWKSFGMQCSCPDSAVPCKHLAAVIYGFSKLIDNDPFKLFRYLGIDLKQALIDKGATVSDAQNVKPLTLSQFLSLVPNVNASTKSKDSLTYLRSIPYAKLTDLSQHVFSLLGKHHPLSNSSNFAEWLKLALKKASRYSETIVTKEGKLYSENPTEILRLLSQTMISFDYKEINFKVQNTCCSDKSFSILLLTLAETTNLFAQNAPEKIEVIRELVIFARKLLKFGNIIPTMVSADNLMPRIYWIPALRSPEVADCFSAIVKGATPWITEIISVKNTKRDFSSTELIFLTITYFINLIVNEYWNATNTVPDSLAQVLFTGSLTANYFDGKTNEETVSQLSKYLKPFLMADSYPWKPVIIAKSSLTNKEHLVSVNFGITPFYSDSQDKSKTKAHITLKKILTEKEFSSYKSAVISVVRTLGEVFSPLAQIAKTQGAVKLSSEELKKFLFEAAPHLMLLGVSIKLPKKLKNLLKPKLVAKVNVGSSASLLGKNGIADFAWKVKIGETEYTLEEIKHIYGKLNGKDVVTNIADEFVYLNPTELSSLIDKAENSQNLSQLEKVRAVLTGYIPGVEVNVSEEIKSRLRTLTDISEINPPIGLNAQLRPYQLRGYSWLVKNLKLGIGSLIADDMGLGKTIQVISSLLYLKESGNLDEKKAIIVAPTSLITNWSRELAKFAPSLNVYIYHGTKRKLGNLDFDILLTSYGTFTKDSNKLATVQYRVLVLDEAQAIKNYTTKTSKAVRAFPVDQVIGMSGTPVENRLIEYWSILSSVQPEILGTAKDFSDTFANPIESNHDEKVAKAFRMLTAPFMLRRVKTDKNIISDLPEKMTFDKFAELTPEQAILYGQVLNEKLELIKKLEEKTKDAQGEEKKNFHSNRATLILSLITELKQICNSPSQYLNTTTDTPDSGKGEMLLEILSKLSQAGRKALIFTQYREMGERLQNWIQVRTGFKPDFLHGAVTPKKRQEMVDSFQLDRTKSALIISLKAGGTGLNLTSASSVIHYDLWWNPAVEAQATDRAYRIGQKSDVLVYRFVTAGTFEEKINEMISKKKDLADLTVATGEAWIGDFTSEEISSLFALSDTRTTSKKTKEPKVQTEIKELNDDPFEFETKPRKKK